MGKYVIFGIVFFGILIVSIGYIDNKRLVSAMERITDCENLKQEGVNQFACGDELYRLERIEDFDPEYLVYEHIVDTLWNKWVVLKAD